MRCHLLCLVTVLGVLFSAANGPAAVIIDVPFDTEAAGLGPGDLYHLAFVTQGNRDAKSSDIGVYNTFVTEEAERSGATTENYEIAWFAIGSTSEKHARDNAVIGADTPVFLLNGTKIADGFDDLWDGTIDSRLDVDQFLTTDISSSVWTGSQYSGIGLSGWTLAGSSGSLYGHTVYTDTKWLRSLSTNTQYNYKFYAMSEELQTAAIPEPSSAVAWLLLTGCGLLWAWRRRRRAGQSAG